MSIRDGKYAKLLIPLSHLYGLGVSLRNFCFNNGLLKSISYPIPIICVGNIAVGGTGKTPHVEYILSVISRNKRVAVISRGYKRKTKGLVIATSNSTPREIGDEPYQIKRKFPNVKVVVDGNRRRAIEHLLSLREEKRPEIIVLDDGFQHRYVKPSFSILLQEYSNPMKDDSLLPYGDLRESPSARFRADCVIITKCPDDMQPIEYSIIKRDLNLFPHQKVFFSSITYNTPKHISSLFDNQEDLPPPSDDASVVVVAGLANPYPMIEYISKRYQLLEEIIFEDHRNFNTKDIAEIEDALLFYKESESNVILLTSEKDAVRLKNLKEKIDPDVFNSIYYLPIEVSIMFRKAEFDSMLHRTACRLSKPIK